MKKMFFLLSVCLMLVVQSCSSDQDFMSLDPTSHDSEISRMIVKFDDRVYETDVKTVGDSVIYLNEEYAEVYRNEIAINPNLAVLVSSDEEGATCVVYYPTEEELLKYNKIMLLAYEDDNMASYGPTTRGTVYDVTPKGLVLAYAELYQNTGFGGICVRGGITGALLSTVGNLKDFGFNDKTSSIKLFNKMIPNQMYTIQYRSPEDPNVHTATHLGSALLPVLKCYRNTGFSGKTLYCVGNPAGSGEDHLDSNLKNLGFNDIISSFDFALIGRNEFTVGKYKDIIFPHK